MASHSASSERPANVNRLLARQDLSTSRTFPTYAGVPQAGVRPVVAEQGAEHFTSFQQRMQALATEVARERSKPRTERRPLKKLEAHTKILERLRNTPAPKQLELSRATQAAKQNVHNAAINGTYFDKRVARFELQKAVQAELDYNNERRARQQELAETPRRRVKRLVKPLGQVASQPVAVEQRTPTAAEERPRTTVPAAVESLLARLATNEQLTTEVEAPVAQGASEALSDEALARAGSADITRLVFPADEPPTVITHPVGQAGPNLTQYATISNQIFGGNTV